MTRRICLAKKPNLKNLVILIQLKSIAEFWTLIIFISWDSKGHGFKSWNIFVFGSKFAVYIIFIKLILYAYYARKVCWISWILQQNSKPRQCVNKGPFGYQFMGKIRVQRSHAAVPLIKINKTELQLKRTFHFCWPCSSCIRDKISCWAGKNMTLHRPD